MVCGINTKPFDVVKAIDLLKASCNINMLGLSLEKVHYPALKYNKNIKCYQF